MFGDACPGTSKYLEVIYTCHQADEEASSSSGLVAPWLRDLSATPPTTTTVRTTTTAATTATEERADREEGLQQFEVVLGAEDDDGEDYEDEEVSVDYPGEQQQQHSGYCAPITERNLFWNWTRGGREAVQPCPTGSSGFARWGCDSDGHWSSQYPNLSECRSHWVRRLEAEFETHPVGETSSRLAEFTRSSVLYGGDLVAIVRLLKRLPERLSREMPASFQSQRVMEHETSVLQARVTRVASDLLDQAQMLAWQDLSDGRRSQLVSLLFQSVAGSSILAAEVLNREKRMTANETNAVADVRVRSARRVEDQFMTDRDEDVSMVVDADSLEETSVNGAVRLGLFVFRNLEYILPGGGEGDFFINSLVAGVALPDAASGRLPDSTPPVVFTLRHRIAIPAGSSPACASWDHQTASWDRQGCQVFKSTATHTTCQCRRLTQYAVLVRSDVASGRAEPHNSNPEEEEDELSWMVLAGSCLLAALTVFLLTLGILYAKRKDLRVCGSEQANGSDGFYPPLAAASPNDSSRMTYRTPADEVARQLQSRQPPNVIFSKKLAGGSGVGVGVGVPFIGNVDQLYNHIYSEIDPASYARYLVNAANANGMDTSSETFSSSGDGGNGSSRNSPVFLQQHQHQHPPLESIHHQPQSSLVSAMSLRMPQTAQPQQPPVQAITLRDGRQLIRLTMEEGDQMMTQQPSVMAEQRCFQV